SKSEMPSYKLNYFDARGYAEVSRQLFVLSDTPYEDNRIPRDQWPELKKTMPFGNIPVLEVDGKQLPQSLAIARYLAKQFGFYGKTAFESAWVDAIADQFKDCLTEIRPFLFVAKSDGNEAEKERMKKEVALPAIEKHFGLLEKAAKNNGANGHFVGESLTFVDLLVSDFVGTFEAFLPGFSAPYPAVTSIRAKTIATPKIKEWIAKRNVTPT
ncbi:hypothetical protein PFISCL1PPCAC_13830, partial [Pristionchus fissidentatus]